MNAFGATAQALMTQGKGPLAMHDRADTYNRRLAEHGIAQTSTSRRRYRELLVTTVGLSQAVSGAILFDAPLHRRTQDGARFIDVLRTAGIPVGINVGTVTAALTAHAGERATVGSVGLRDRLIGYAAQGARVAKWRAVLPLAYGLPSPACIDANAAHALMPYAALCARRPSPCPSSTRRC